MAVATCTAPALKEGLTCGREARHSTPQALCGSHHRQLGRDGTLAPLKLNWTPRLEGVDCSGPGTEGECGRPAIYAKPAPMCASHRRQFVRTGKMNPLRPVSRKQPARERNEQGDKFCTPCKRWLPESVFGPDPQTGDKLTGRCRQCLTDDGLRRKFGITVAQYEERLAAQGGTCAVCKSPPHPTRRMHVDHDHACCPDYNRTCGKCIRGLLCTNCNLGLGNFKDAEEVMLAAIEYLGVWRSGMGDIDPQGAAAA